jgi:hypothetical protein
VRVVFNPYWLVRTQGVCTLDDATIIGESAFLPDNERTIKLVCKKKSSQKMLHWTKKGNIFPFHYQRMDTVDYVTTTSLSFHCTLCLFFSLVYILLV